MYRVLLKDDKGYALPYVFWLAHVLEEHLVLVQIWSLQTIKDVIVTVNHVALSASLRHTENPLQMLKNFLAKKNVELEAA